MQFGGGGGGNAWQQENRTKLSIFIALTPEYCTMCLEWIKGTGDRENENVVKVDFLLHYFRTFPHCCNVAAIACMDVVGLNDVEKYCTSPTLI